jgi:hypothetical protein
MTGPCERMTNKGLAQAGPISQLANQGHHWPIDRLVPKLGL